MKTNLFPVLVCLIMGMFIPCLSAADKAAPRETTVVIATGVSTNAEKALLKALRNAVQQVVGVIVDAKTLIEKDKVIKDKILDFSNGFVEKFEKLKEGKNDDGLYEITIRATVKQRQLIKRLEAIKMSTGPVTLEPLPSGGGAALLKKTLKDLDLPDSLLRVKAMKPKPDILNTTENEPRLVKLEWVFQIQFDLVKYQKVVLPKLKQVLGSIDIAKKQIKFPLHHSVPFNKADSFGKDWNKLGVYEYLFGFSNPYGGMGAADFAPRLPRAGKDPSGREIQSNNKPVAGGVPVFLLEGWQPLTGLRTYTVYWVDLESAKVLKDYFLADIALQLDLSGPDKKALFSETIRFRGALQGKPRTGVEKAAMGDGVIMRGANPASWLIGDHRQAQVMRPTVIYPGRSEFIDESKLLGISGGRFTSLVGRDEVVPPGVGGVNTISIMPLMHLRMNVDPRGRQTDLRGVTKVAQYSWQPLVPLKSLKDLTQISCSFVNAGKQ